MRRTVAAATSLALLLAACGGTEPARETDDAPELAESPSIELLDPDGGSAAEPAPPTPSPNPDAPTPSPAPVAAEIVLAAGDIAWCGPDEDDTGALLQTEPSATVLALGDLAYDLGRLEDFQRCYLPAWGDALDRTKPVPGNHDAATPGLAGYFDVFGDEAGHEPEGYYSFDLGPKWHVVALNSNCTQAAPCTADGEQVQWLRTDLEQLDDDVQVLAMWHHPLQSSGAHGPDPRSQAFWDVLTEHGADLVLNGHEHNYERFAPLEGVRQFVVGTGGAVLRPFRDRPADGSEVRDRDHHGVLRLELRECGYAWRFLSTETGAEVDSGEHAGC